MFAIIYKPDEFSELYLAKSLNNDFWWDNGTNDSNILKFSSYDSAKTYIDSNSDKFPNRDLSRVDIISGYKEQEQENNQKSFIPMSKEITFESIHNMIKSVVYENKIDNEEFEECGVGGATTSGFTDAAALQYQSGGGTKKKDEEVEEESVDIEEMARGILTPQEHAKREYQAEYPEAKVSTADQFLKKVILNPEAEGHDKYIAKFAKYVREFPEATYSTVSFRNLPNDIKNDPAAQDEMIATTYAQDLLSHRKDMGKAAYHTKGTFNAYGKEIQHKKGFNPYNKQDIINFLANKSQVTPASVSNISDKYDSIVGDEANYDEANKMLNDYFNSEEFANEEYSTQFKIVNNLKNNADLDSTGMDLVMNQENLIKKELDSFYED